MFELLTDTKRRKTIQRRPATLSLRASENATIEETSPPWILLVNRRLADLRKLKVNWDGEGAPSIDFECCMSSLLFLLDRAANETPAPEITPTSVGGLQLEWHLSGIDLEVCFHPLKGATFFYVARDGSESEGEVEKDGQMIGAILRSLPAPNERYRSAI